MTTTTVEDLRQGAWVQPVNRWQGADNSIHNDEVARSVGMRGGTIPGTVHLNHFRPLMDELFGDRWLINGTVSMYYTYATAHLEDVRAVIKAPPGPTQTTGDVGRSTAHFEACAAERIEELDGVWIFAYRQMQRTQTPFERGRRVVAYPGDSSFPKIQHRQRL